MKLLFAILLLFVVGVTAKHHHKHKHPEKPDHHKHDKVKVKKRTLDVAISNKHLEIEGKSQDKHYQDYLHYALDLDDSGAQIVLNYRAHQSHKKHKKHHEDKKQVQKRVRFTCKLLQILEVKTAAAFEPGHDERVSKLKLGPQGWTSFKHEVESDEGSKVHIFSTSTRDGKFTLRGKISETWKEHKKQISAGTISPNWLKLDFEINDYQYRERDTKLVLVMLVASSSKYKEKTHDGFSVTIEDDDPIDAMFAWLPEATYNNGTDVDILATYREDSMTRDDAIAKRLFFTFDTRDRIKNLVWDPELGVAWPEQSIWLLVAIVCGCVAIVAILAFLVYRRRKAAKQSEPRGYKKLFGGK